MQVNATNAPLECNMLSYINMKARDHHFTILNCDITIMDFAAWNVTRFDDIQPPWSFIGGLRTTQAQTSLRIRAVWSAPLLFVFWKVSYVNLLQVKS